MEKLPSPIIKYILSFLPPSYIRRCRLSTRLVHTTRGLFWEHATELFVNNREVLQDLLKTWWRPKTRVVFAAALTPNFDLVRNFLKPTNVDKLAKHILVNHGPVQNFAMVFPQLKAYEVLAELAATTGEVYLDVFAEYSEYLYGKIYVATELCLFRAAIKSRNTHLIQKYWFVVTDELRYELIVSGNHNYFDLKGNCSIQLQKNNFVIADTGYFTNMDAKFGTSVEHTWVDHRSGLNKIKINDNIGHLALLDSDNVEELAKCSGFCEDMIFRTKSVGAAKILHKEILPYYKEEKQIQHFFSADLAMATYFAKYVVKWREAVHHGCLAGKLDVINFLYKRYDFSVDKYFPFIFRSGNSESIIAFYPRLSEPKLRDYLVYAIRWKLVRAFHFFYKEFTAKIGVPETYLNIPQIIASENAFNIAVEWTGQFRHTHFMEILSVAEPQYLRLLLARPEFVETQYYRYILMLGKTRIRILIRMVNAVALHAFALEHSPKLAEYIYTFL